MWKRRITALLWATMLLTASVFALSGGKKWDIPKLGDLLGPAPNWTQKEGFVGPPEPPRLVLWTPEMAVQAALADLQTVPEFQRRYIRYLFVPDGDMRSVRTCSLAINYVSRGSAIYLPLPLAGNHLLRVDMTLYAPRETDLREWLSLWEDFAFDPTFSLLLTKDTLEFAAAFDLTMPKRKVTKTRKVPGPWREVKRDITHRGGDFHYPDDTGRVVPAAKMAPGEYTAILKFKTEVDEDYVEEVPELLASDVDVVRFNSRGIDPVSLVRLQELTYSQAPVVEHRYWKFRALSQIRDKDKVVYDTVFGGRYYALRGIKKQVNKKGEKGTDRDLFFEKLGIGNIRAGLTVDELFDTLRSDQRQAMFRSDVTGKPRVVFSFHTPADKEGGSWGAITADVKDKDIDIGDRGFANLLKPRFAAQEAIFPTVTSLSIFALFNDKGELQDEVPPDVANDSTIPHPHTQRLQPAIGCIRCHGSDGSDGWKPLRNDIKQLLDGRLDVFGDLGAGKRNAFSPDTFDRLAGLYAGDFSKNLRRARDDVAEATLKATGPWEGGVGDQTDVAKLAAVRLGDEYRDYWYEEVTAAKALQDLGLDVPANKAKEMFGAVLPPDLRNQIGGFVPEDPRIAALRQGLNVSRADWAFAQSFAAERSKGRVEELRKAGQQK